MEYRGFSQFERTERWVELLGIDTSSDDSMTNFPVYWNFQTEDAVRNLTDARTIEQDVIRTRSNDAFFRDQKIRLLMKETLVRFCAYYKTYYLQGLNEILAPMLTLRRAIDAMPEAAPFHEEAGDSTSSSSIALTIASSPTEASLIRGQSNDSSEVSRHVPLGSLSADSNDDIYAPALYIYSGSVDSSDDAFLHSSADSDDGAPGGRGIQGSESEDIAGDVGNRVITDNTSKLLNYVDSTFNICLTIFDRIISRFAPTLFTKTGVRVLQTQLIAMHVLLYYFDAELAEYLVRCGINTDVYAPSWFASFFSQRLPVAISLHLWDLMLQVNRPHIFVFLSVALVLHHKERLLDIDEDTLPQTLSLLRFSSTDELDQVFAHALLLEQSSPTSALEMIHALAYDVTVGEEDREMYLQRFLATPGLVISALDLADTIMTSNNIHSTEGSSVIENGTICVGKFILQNRKRLTTYLILDCKTPQNSTTGVKSSSGGYGQIYIAGTLPLNPDIIDCICKTAKSRLKSAKSYLDIDYGYMTASAQATLELLLSMRWRDVSLIIIGDSPSSSSNAVDDNKTNNSTGVDESVDSTGQNHHLLSADRRQSHFTPPPASSDLARLSAGGSESSDHPICAEEGSSSGGLSASSAPSEKLAASLLVLGFSRVCILPTRDADNYARLGSPRGLSLLRDDMSAVCTDSRRMYDRSTLIQWLIYFGAKFMSDTENRILNVPQDPVIAQKVYQFMLSDSLNKSNGSISSFNTMIIGFEDGLRQLEKLHDDFVETLMLLPPVHGAFGAVVNGFSNVINNNPTTNNTSFSSGDSSSHSTITSRPPIHHSPRIVYTKSLVHSGSRGSSDEAHREISRGLDDKGCKAASPVGSSSININSSMQRTVAHKMILKEVKKMTYSLAPICDDCNGLERAFFDLKEKLLFVSEYSKGSLRKMK